MSDRTSPVQSAVDQLLDLLGEDKARAILGTLGQRSAQAELERAVVRRLAVQLLEARAPRWQIRDRLVARGINWRTAYRVIDAALSAPVTCSANAGPDLSIQLRRLEALQPQEIDMSTVINDLKSKLAAMRSQRAAINVTARREAAEKANADYEASRQRQAANAERDAFQFDAGERERHAQLAEMMRHTRRMFDEGRTKAAQLDRDISRLSDMLGAKELIQQATERLNACQQTTAAAQTQVQAAEDALGKIEALIGAEEQAYEHARTDAAAQLLSAVKAGSDPSTIAAATRDKISTLEIARVSAQQELEAARAAHSAAVEQQAKAKRAISQAQASDAELQHEVAYDEYVKVLAAFIASRNRAGLEFPGVQDPRPHAIERAGTAAVLGL